MFDWDDATIDHLRRHGIEPEDVAEAFADARRVGVAVYSTASEARRGTLGATQAGRVLVVVTTKRANRTRVVTARDANPEEKRRYRKREK